MIEIVYLDEVPGAVEVLAPAFWAEWGVHDGLSLEQVTAKLRACLNREHLPLALAAREGGELVGTVGLHDRPVVGRAGLGPWLVALWVAPRHRRRGLGAELIAAAERTAQELGIGELYAATSTAVGLFQRAGWGELERFAHNGEDLSLFHRRLPGR
ncbi:MAG: GNAT family N-acetyltransferase [Gemmatimonadota bacterium]